MKTSTKRLTVPSVWRDKPFRRVGWPIEPRGTWPVQSLERDTLYEVITPNSDKSRGRKVWKSFSHYKRWESVPDTRPCHGLSCLFYHPAVPQYILVGLDKVSDVDVHNGFGDVGESGPFAGLPQTLDTVALEEGDPAFVPAPLILEDLERMALKTMAPSIRAQLSLLNSLLELKDFAKLGKSLSKVKELISLVKARGSKSKTLAQLLRVSADSYLQYMFNFRPLLSDIVGFHRAMSKSVARYKKQLDFEGRPQVAHFSYKWDELPPYYEDITVMPNIAKGQMQLARIATYQNYIANCGASVTRKVVSSPTVFHAQMQYVARHPVILPTELARGLALLDGLGVNLNPAIIWNAIPWSFVVDWFVRVSEWLDGFKVGNLDPQVTVLQYLWSVKRKRKVALSMNYPTWVDDSDGYTSVAPTGTEYSEIGVLNEVSYRRHVGLPDPSLFSTSGLSMTELSLGLALGVSKILEPKRRPIRKPTNWSRILNRNVRALRRTRIRNR